MKKFKQYLKIWWLMSRNSFSMILSQKTAMVFFLTGKIIRFVFFVGFLYFLLLGTKNLAGYTPNQTIFFFLGFNLIDVISQFFFREAYKFRPKIISGDFDLVLEKPISALFTVLMGGADIMDLITIPPLILATYYVGSLLDPNFLGVILFLLLLINGLVIATAFHIAVMSLGIITFEIDHTIMIYRDLTSLGRFPVDIYKQPLQGILTYLLPVGIMMTLPAKALMGLVSFRGVAWSFFISAVLIFLAIRFWNYSLTRYTSASS